MNNLAATLAKLTALAVGGVIGALLVRLYEEEMAKRAEERSQRDKRRYEQGLGPIQSKQQEL